MKGVDENSKTIKDVIKILLCCWDILSSSKIDAILPFFQAKKLIIACSKEIFLAAALKYSLNESLIYIE